MLGQTAPDSLLSLMQTRKDTIGIRAGFELNKYFINKKAQPDSVLFYTPTLIEKAAAIGDRFGETKGHAWIGNAYFFKQRYSEAILAYKQGLFLAVKYNQLLLEADLHNRIGACYNNQNKQGEAIVHLIEAAKAFEQLRDLAGQAQAYYGISISYKQQKQPAKRLKYSLKAAEIAEQLPSNESGLKTIIFASTATCLIEVDYTSNLSLNKAKRYADLGKKICEEFSLKNYLTEYQIVYSGYYYARKNYKKSIAEALSGLSLGVTKTDTERFNLYYRLAEGYREDKEIKLAYKYIDSAKMLNTAKSPMFAYILAQSEYRLNKMTGESQAALSSFEKLQQLKDSVLSIEKNKAINEVVEKYESELKDKKILALEKEQLKDILRIRTLIAIVAVLFLLFVLFVFIYRQRNIQSKLKISLAEQRLNRARMDPHFFFNVLTTLQGFVLKEDNKVAAASHISKFAAIMRASLESTYNEYCTIAQDAAFLKKYIELFLLKEEGWFLYDIIFDESIAELEVPAMLSQPFVENAINHGFKKRTEQGKLEIKYELASQYIRITITDNGVGVQNGEKSEHVSRASQIIKDRLTLLGKNKKDISVSYEPIKQGTQVIVQIPNHFA